MIFKLLFPDRSIGRDVGLMIKIGSRERILYIVLEPYLGGLYTW
jgi:hypothetical protein